MRAPVNPRDPTGMRKTERAAEKRMRELVHRYTQAMAESARRGDIAGTMADIGRLEELLGDDIRREEWAFVQKAVDGAVSTSDRVMGNLRTGITLGPVGLPPEYLAILKSSIEDNAKSISGDLKRRVSEAIVQGYDGGLGPREIARSIRRAGDEAVPHAETIVRTEIMRTADQTAKARYAAAGCVGYMSFPTDDDRLCPECMRRALGPGRTHGALKIYGPGEPMALPWHPNCRCARIPVFAGRDGRIEEVTI